MWRWAFFEMQARVSILGPWDGVGVEDQRPLLHTIEIDLNVVLSCNRGKLVEGAQKNGVWNSRNMIQTLLQWMENSNERRGSEEKLGMSTGAP